MAAITEQEADDAETWVARLHAADCTAAEREAFERWRAADPAHALAYAQAERIHRRSTELAHDPLLAAAARAARRKSARGGSRHRTRWAQALLATAAVLLVAVVVWRGIGGHESLQQYATVIGEQRTLQLSDGTTVVLDTDSAISVRYGSGGREVTLDRGRAQFDVAHEVQRPFLVRAGAGFVRDIGTRFQVSEQTGDVTVTLIDGIVAVSVPATDAQSTLAPGQQVSFDRGGRLGTASAADLAVAQGWTRGDLVFKNRSLADLVAEMNRYSDTKLQLGDESLRKLTISGVFHAGDQASLVQALRSGWSLQAKQTSPREIVLQTAPR